MNKTIELRACVAAVHDNKILLVPHGDADGEPVLWRIPGGDLRSGESQEEAAIRGFTEARIHRWTGMDGVRAAEGGEGVTGAMIRGLEFG